MQHAMVRYTVKPGRAVENESLIQQVFAELAGSMPPGLRYAAFRLDDGVSFVHIVSHESEEAVKLLRESPAFQTFRAGLEERCDVAPARTVLHEVGSYQFIGAEVG